MVCDDEAMALRAEIGEAASPSASSSGCIAVLHLEHAPERTLAPASPHDTAWAIDPDGRIIDAVVTAVRVEGQWRSLETAQRLSGTYDVAITLEHGEARLLRVGAPFAHAQVMRLR
jgi:hypothetical protein